MPNTPHIAWLPRVLLLAPLALALLSLPVGCHSSKPMLHGKTGLTATYSGRSLASILPPEVQVQAAHAAMEQTFRARGYAIESSNATGETATIVARPPRTSAFPKVEFVASSVVGGTSVSITNAPWGDEGLSRSLLDSMLQRLGL